MSEKMKCARCGKRFKQANKKQVLCADCLAKERAAKKVALVQPSATGAANSASHRPGAGEMSAGITIVQATPPPELGAYGSQARHAERIAQTPSQPARPSHPAHGAPTAERLPQPPVAAPTSKPATAPAPPAGAAQGVHSQQRPKAPAPQPEKRARQPRPVTPPFVLTDETRAAIEQRYLELSQPVEFDGIRTQIANELNVPKPTVKLVIRDLRISRQLPSWWELQAYKGTDETLTRIRERYLPLLPVPPVGVHKQIAAELNLEAPQVYQAIRRLRAEMKLPQYNPPESHTNEPPVGKTPATEAAPADAPVSASAE